LWSCSDQDWWAFTGNSNDVVTIAVENPGSPGSSSLAFNVFQPDGNPWTGFGSDGNGRGQQTLTLTASGTFTVRVTCGQNFQGEYRLRVSKATPPVAMENEYNDELGYANILALAAGAPGHQVSRVAGYIGLNDGGDYYRLGTLGAGVTINLQLSQPALSPLTGVLTLYDAGGGLVATNAVGVNTLSYPVTAATNYYLRVTADSNTSGLLSQYLLAVDLVDTIAPVVTAVSFGNDNVYQLVAAGSTND
jgi:hypothetical protein